MSERPTVDPWLVLVGVLAIALGVSIARATGF